MLNVVMLSIFSLNVVMPIVRPFIPSVVMLTVVMLGIVTLNVVMLGVMAPRKLRP
jgi:hypothetical protein